MNIIKNRYEMLLLYENINIINKSQHSFEINYNVIHDIVYM